MSRAWTIANAVMLVAFAFSVVVQCNDPDPLAWVAIYTAATIVCGLELRRRTHPAAPAAVVAVALIWATTLAPRVIGKVPFGSMFDEFEMANIPIEESREMYGLVFIAGWMAAVAVAAWRRKGKGAENGVNSGQ